MKISCLIIDDDRFIQRSLHDLLTEHLEEIVVLGKASNGAEGVQLVQQLRPDLIFLDVQMPDMTGFEMLSQLKEIDFQTIFVTSFSHYAIKAIRFNALDYLVKPIDLKELRTAISRFRSTSSPVVNQIHVKQALDNFQIEKPEEQFFFLPTQGGEERMRLKDIIRIEGERNYSFIYLANGKKLLSSKTLGWFEEIFVDKGFYRCHRSHIVNGHHVVQLTTSGELLMKNENHIPVSRRKKIEVRKWVKGIA